MKRRTDVINVDSIFQFTQAEGTTTDDFRMKREENELILTDPKSLPLVTRSRFVLFASFSPAGSGRGRDVRDKFHVGTIRVASNLRRMKDFLYFRSLKLDPGEAIIAQVE